MVLTLVKQGFMLFHLGSMWILIILHNLNLMEPILTTALVIDQF